MAGSPPPSDTNNQHPTASVAVRASAAGEKFLSNLPSRGLFSSTVISSNLGGMRVYVCEHETSPPDDQHIKTDQTNILIRSLVLKKKADSSSKEGKGTAAESSRKRSAEITLDGKSKRAMTTQSPQQEGSKSRPPQKELQNLTVERLRALLKEKGLSIRGRKDELIARLRAANE